MKEFLKQVLDQTRHVWGTLSGGQRVMLATFIVGSAVVLTVVGLWSSAPNFVPLVAGLSPAETATATAKLKDDGIPFRYEASRSTILVPSGNLEEARLVLAGQGLMNGDGNRSGFEIFDENSFGMTDFVQKVKFLRALQGSLERKIKALDGIEDAHVTLSIPKDELFVRDEQPPKASVEVKARRGFDIGGGQVNSIRHIVSAAVPKLRPKNVAVMDSDGRLLARFQQDADDASSLAGENMEARVRMENYLSDKVDVLLAQVLGPGRAAVQVAADLDFERIQRSTTRALSPDPYPLLEKTEKTTKIDGGSMAGGAPGVASNAPGGSGSRSGQNQSVTELKTETKDIKNHYDMVTETVMPEVGSIKRISVAVLIRPTLEGQGEERKFVGLPKESIASLTEAVKQAIGFTAARNDVVSVENAPIPTSIDATGMPTPMTPPGNTGLVTQLEPYLPTLATTFGILALAFVFWRTMRRLTETPATYSAMVGSSAGAPQGGGLPRSLGNVAQLYTETDSANTDATRNIQSQIQGLVTQNSSQASDIVRSLLNK